MWLMSNRPAAVRTAVCSSTMVRVLHRHVPAAELDHAAAVGDVPVVQRGAQRHEKSLSRGIRNFSGAGRVGKFRRLPPFQQGDFARTS